MKARWIVFGVSALWWIPCLLAFFWERSPVLLGLPMMGFYPWNTEGSSYSAVSGYTWEILSLLAFGWLAIIALRKNSIVLSTVFAILLSLSSMLVLYRAWLIFSNLD
jgi:hypothetical protein